MTKIRRGGKGVTSVLDSDKTGMGRKKKEGEGCSGMRNRVVGGLLECCSRERIASARERDAP